MKTFTDEMVTPLPEVLAGDEWMVEAGDGACDIRGRRMYTPVLDDPRDRQIRAHEMGHARWSPPGWQKRPDVPMMAMQKVEDCRIHAHLKNAGIDLSTDIFEERHIAEWRALVKNDKLAGPAILVATYNTGSYDTVMEFVSTRDAYIAKCVREELFAKRKLPLYADTLRAAKVLTDLTGSKLTPVTLAGEDEDDDEEKKIEGFPDVIDDDDLEDALKLIDMVHGRGAKKEGKWGKMKIRTAELPVIHNARVRAPTKIAADTGVVPTNISRYCTDGAIFNHKRPRKKGGTLLIDRSSSISMQIDELLEVLRMIPAATVAQYAGSHKDGILEIIAKDGRRASEEHLEMRLARGANVIDGPALRWLARQPEPRIWVCDGLVTGISDRMAANLSKEAAHLMLRGKIRRVNKMTAVSHELLK
jgi:hypothetical protein